MSPMENSRQTYINPEIIRLMKSGGGIPQTLIKEYMQDLQKPDYPLDFVAFMDQMISESGMDRKTLIARSGLSESLAYKYLNGNKKTNERDYILAFCIALHLTFAQTQHALRCYGLPLLGDHDIRATIIRWGIEQEMDMYQINECLENQGLPLIRISSDMPSAEIKDSMYYEPRTAQSSEEPRLPAYQPVNVPHDEEYEEINSSTDAIHCGNAPFDFNYFGSMTLQGKDGKTYHLEITYLVTGESFFVVMNDEQYAACQERNAKFEAYNPDDDPKVVIDLNEPDPEVMESYESLLAATASRFFPYFMELDHQIDKKVAETLQNTDDTRCYNYRLGAHWNGGEKPEIYIELFNTTQPEHREYYQMIENIDHECIYTASHESYFMQIEMGDIYDIYYTKRREPEYFLKATDKDFDRLDKRYQMIFHLLRHHLHTAARKDKIIVEISDEQFCEEEMEFYAEQFAINMQAGEPEGARKILLEMESNIRIANLSTVRKLMLATLNDWRLYQVAMQQCDEKEKERIREMFVSRKEEALRFESELGKDAPLVFTAIADVLQEHWRTLQRQGEDSHTLERIREILDLMDHGAYADDDYCEQRFEIYHAYAFQIDGEEPEEAEKYYQKAIREATKYHLDQSSFSARAVATVYNNYAWLLWNKFGSEEAIMYYGRAIELTETYLDNGMEDPNHARANLAHYGGALIIIYEATSREKEKKRLLRRLQNSGVTPEE